MRTFLRILSALISTCSVVLVLASPPGDDPDSDSLQKTIQRLQNAREHVQVARLYFQIGAEYIEKGSYPHAQEPFQHALEAAKAAASDSLMVETHYQLGYISYLTGDFPTALSHFNKVLQLNEKNIAPVKTSKSLAHISSIYLNIGEVEKSLEYQRQAMDNLEATKDSMGLAYSLYLLSATFFDQKAYDQSLAYNDSAYIVSRQANWSQMIFTCIAGRGNTFLNQKNIDKAFYFARWSKAYADSIQYPVGKAYAISLLGEIYSHTHFTDSAMYYLTEGLKLNQELGYKAGEISNLVSMGRMYASKQNYTQALESAELALKYTDEMGLGRHGDDILGLLADIHFQAGNLREAYQFQKLDKQLHDSLFNENVVKETAALTVAQKIRNIENHQELALQQEKARLYQIGGIIAFILFSLLALVLFSRNRIQARANTLLNAKNQELARTNKELEQFAYVASHDLKEPLRMIASYTGLLKRRYNHLFDDDAYEYMGFVEEGVHRMDALLKDLMIYAQIDEDHPKFEVTDVEQVVHSSLKLLRPTIEETGAHIVVSWLPRIKANASQLSQLFLNLISNSLKYRGSEPPEIRVESKETEKEVVFSVTDNGIGIDEAYQEKIFSIFQRLHQREQYEGTGIGLAICRKIAENHGGRIWVESQPGKGSTFFVAMPRNL
ncbi:MAG: ATP-binding protein [Bacteroidia bacterium]|nr:ATP-binding protein [Bacteroidia bacterium]